ncbi:hypothetical protein APUTEX25_001951 [Auxenochlorella protothecoides]|uniref:Uncharacterized protein n=1 Tax=Auxenochlorella protothecoides TaxID=3075 RepID=A0A3M7KXB1_AUXPR|nr:hypothetical protein APUTEX25_001951 [Auxenochlorella protothecoides]|eukprot:RMZ54375.1 hypothetical protein APUTEX25_001951 [Auxenochlorella protothecoides]
MAVSRNLTLGIAAALAYLSLVAGQSGTYNPCTEPNVVNKGDGFVVGLAYWPAGTIVNWGPAVNASGAPGLNPCITGMQWEGGTLNYLSYLSNQGVTFSTFMVTVDTLAALRTTKAEEDAIWGPILGVQQTEVLSVIAFRGQNRSDAKYIRSNMAALTGGTGIVEQMSLFIGFNRGVFAGFSWWDFGQCTACGGLVSDQCIRTSLSDSYQLTAQASCAAPLSSCTCRGLSCSTSTCSTTIIAAFQGSDASGRTFTSAFKIQALNKYSISDFFSQLMDKLSGILPGISTTTVSSSGSSISISGSEEAMVARLSSIDPADRLVATRALKNESIVNPRRKLTLLRAGAVPALLSQLVQGPSPKQATQSLSALASLLLVQQGCACLVEEGGTDVLLMALCSQDAGVAAASASALRALCVHAPLRDLPPACCSALCRLVAQAGADSVAPAHVMAASLRCCVLSTLVALLDCKEPLGCERALLLLLGTDASLLAAAVDAGAVARLAGKVARCDCPPQHLPDALRLLSELCSDEEAQRRVVEEAGALPRIAASLAPDREQEERAAAVHLVRVLSRSTKLLRGGLGPLDLAQPLLALTRDGGDAAAAAAAALSNAVAEPGPAREAVLRAGGLQRFVGMTGEPALRALGFWALSSLASRAGDELKRSLMAALPWSAVRDGVASGDAGAAAKAWLLLRNLAHASGATLDDARRWSGGELLGLLRRGARDVGHGACPAARLHALYAAVNLAAGPRAHKELLLAEGWAYLLVGVVGERGAACADAHREAAIWALINLAWGGEDDGGAADRAARIRTTGAEGALRGLPPGTGQAVLERARQALDKLKLEPLLGRRGPSDSLAWEAMADMEDE